MPILPRIEDLPEDLQYKQLSCANCRNCRKHDVRLGVDEWECHAAQNLIPDKYSPVTGQLCKRILHCSDLRFVNPVCPWHVPEGYYYPNGNYKTIWHLQKEETISQSSKRLSQTTLDDI